MALRLVALVFTALSLSTCHAQPTAIITVDEGHVYLSGRELNPVLDADAEALLSVMHELCHYYSMCNESLNIPDHVAPLLNCCVPCDCSDDCFAVGNCCRDKIDARERTEETRMVTKNGEQCTALNPDAYLLVGTCHPDYEGQSKAGCVSPDPISLHDLTPVDSLDSNVTYRNIHCARCNYETGSVFRWNARIRCKSYVPASTVESLGSSFLGNGCNFIAEYNGYTKRCYMPTTPDECAGYQYETLCNTVDGGRAYINELWYNLCLGCGLSFGDACMPGGPRSFFEVIVSLGDYPNEDSKSDRRRDDSGGKRVEKECPVGETLVQQKNACLRVICPPSQLTETAREVHCIDPFFLVEGLCLDTRLSVTIPTDGTATPEMERFALEEAGKLFPFDFYSPLNAVVEPTVLNYMATSNEIVYTIHVVESIAAFGNVYTQYILFKDRLDSVSPAPGVRIELATTGLSFTPQPLEEIGYLDYADNMTGFKYECLRMIAVSELQFCRAVILSAEEYGFQGDDLVMNDGAVFQSYEYVVRESRDGNVSHVQVCLETYLSRTNRASSESLLSGQIVALFGGLAGLLVASF